MNDQGIFALAALISILRSDWQAPGVRAALIAAFTARQVTGFELAHAALNAAANPDVRTPAVIALDGQHWQRPLTDAERPTPTPSRHERCRRCGRLVSEPEAVHAEHCGPQKPMPAQLRAVVRRALHRDYQHGNGCTCPPELGNPDCAVHGAPNRDEGTAA